MFYLEKAEPKTGEPKFGVLDREGRENNGFFSEYNIELLKNINLDISSHVSKFMYLPIQTVNAPWTKTDGKIDSLKISSSGNFQSDHKLTYITNGRKVVLDENDIRNKVQLLTDDVEYADAPYNLEDLTNIAKFFDACYSNVFFEKQSSPRNKTIRLSSPTAWINILFTFGRIIGSIQDKLDAMNTMRNLHIQHYMIERSNEGRYINKSVNDMKESLRRIIRGQYKNKKAFANILDCHAMLFCHPLLDGKCFQDHDDDDPKKPYDPICQYLMSFQEPNKIKLFVMNVVNMSKYVPDPPSVPYIKANKLYHALRQLSFLAKKEIFNRNVIPLNYEYYVQTQLKNKSSNETVTHIDVPLDVSSKYYSNIVGIDIPNPALGGESQLSINQLLQRALESVRDEIDKAHNSQVLLDNVRKSIQECLELLHINKSPIYETSSDHAKVNLVVAIQKIMYDINCYNTSSVIGNLGFVNSLMMSDTNVSYDLYNDEKFLYDYSSYCIPKSESSDTRFKSYNDISHHDPKEYSSLINFSEAKFNAYLDSLEP
jgi:hypothetical protein